MNTRAVDIWKRKGYARALHKINYTKWDPHSPSDFIEYSSLYQKVVKGVEEVGRTYLPILHPRPEWRFGIGVGSDVLGGRRIKK